jgi:hypothetical protein
MKQTIEDKEKIKLKGNGKTESKSDGENHEENKSADTVPVISNILNGIQQELDDITLAVNMPDTRNAMLLIGSWDGEPGQTGIILAGNYANVKRMFKVLLKKEGVLDVIEQAVGENIVDALRSKEGRGEPCPVCGGLNCGDTGMSEPQMEAEELSAVLEMLMRLRTNGNS